MTEIITVIMTVIINISDDVKFLFDCDTKIVIKIKIIDKGHQSNP